ncbi:MAG: bis-aminopropyl spermidine synthase family protein, partial [Dactylosporangium sp.]|nr:bis-aminopropyl spermidine synthase family protein [Dactylosporangium sp.]
VLDIDLRVVNAVRAAAWQLGLDKRTAVVHIDLADRAAVEAVLDDYGDSYDVVVTDPPYAHDGMLCFVSVAASLAAVGGEIQVAVPAVLAEAWTDELMREVQGFLCDNGFVLDRVEPGVFTYETSDVVSSLVTARRLVGAPAPSRWDWSDRFYTTRTLPSQPTA